jgi:hypothetical protein
LSGIWFAIYFLTAPPAELLQPADRLLVARHGDRLLRWHATNQASVSFAGRTLARFSAPALAVADYQDPGFLRLTLHPNVADNSLVYSQSAEEIFVNARKIGCRVEGPLRRLYYPVLQNREPCER